IDLHTGELGGGAHALCDRSAAHPLPGVDAARAVPCVRTLVRVLRQRRQSRRAQSEIAWRRWDHGSRRLPRPAAGIRPSAMTFSGLAPLARSAAPGPTAALPESTWTLGDRDPLDGTVADYVAGLRKGSWSAAEITTRALERCRTVGMAWRAIDALSPA